MKFAESLTPKSLWKEVAPFVEQIVGEQEVMRIAVEQSDVFVIYGDAVLDGTWNDGQLKLDTPRPDFDADGYDDIARSIDLCSAAGISGFDRRYLPEYLKIYIRSDLYFLVMFESTSARYRLQIEGESKKPSDARGDIFRQINTNLYIASERR